jgi:methionyl-tRNA formyltransferase
VSHLKNRDTAPARNPSLASHVAPAPRLRLIGHVSAPRSKILFLGYSEQQTRLLNALLAADCEVWHTEDKITSTDGYDLVISFGFRHIIKKETLASSPAPIVNLHIAYLPWNRGAHPNFWSFYDSTPSGVSIHLIDEGIDTGPVLYQRYVNFSAAENTFSATYLRLVAEIEDLFLKHLEEIVSKQFIAVPQRRKGSFHRASELPPDFRGWDCDIRTEIKRLDDILLNNPGHPHVQN